MICLAIVEDNLIYQNALAAYIEKMPDMQIVHMAANLRSLPALVEAGPDVVIMDIDLGNESGIEGVKRIKEALPRTEIFMLTVFDDEEKILASIRAGASGYLLKKDSPKKIVEAVRNVYKGEGAISGIVVKKLLNTVVKPAPAAPNLDEYGLTKREKEVVQLLIKGFAYKEIAARCFISMATLNTHIRNIYDKLGIHTRAEIAARFGK